jgi:hypothetical protein
MNEWPELVAWYSEAVQKVQSTRVESIHVDYLVESPPQDLRLVELAWDGLGRIVQLVVPRLEAIKPMLIIPLVYPNGERWADHVELSVPDLSRLADSLSPEPPILYLVDRTTDMHLFVQECYRTVVQYDHLQRRDVCVHAEYVAMRGANEIAEGVREFQRDIEVSVYPWSLVPPSRSREGGDQQT